MLFGVSSRNMKCIIISSDVQNRCLYTFYKSLLYLKPFYFSEATIQMADGIIYFVQWILDCCTRKSSLTFHSTIRLPVVIYFTISRHALLPADLACIFPFFLGITGVLNRYAHYNVINFLNSTLLQRILLSWTI